MNAAAADFIAQHGVPDLVIGNAGVSHGNLTEIAEDVATFREMLDINVLGLVSTFHPFVAPMRARGSGSLAGIASVAGFRGLPGATAYSASKAAAIRYLEGLRVELRGTGVRVTTICPGFIATPMTRGTRTRCPSSSRRTMPRAASRARSTRARAMPSFRGRWRSSGRILGVLPECVYDASAAGRERKPRKPAR